MLNLILHAGVQARAAVGVAAVAEGADPGAEAVVQGAGPGQELDRHEGGGGG